MGLFNFYLSADKQQKEEKRCQKAAKKKIGVMNVILALIGISAAAFTTAMIWLFIEQGNVPDTLITCFFAFIGGECGIMGLIKTAKTKHKPKEDKEDEEVQG